MNFKWVIFCCFLSVFFVSSVSATVTVYPHTYLGLTSYSTYINFEEQQTFETVSLLGTQIDLGEYILSSESANLTITQITTNLLSYEVSANGTQTIECDNEPSVVVLDGTQKNLGDGWDYTEGITTITDSTSNVSLTFTTLGSASTFSVSSGLVLLLIIVAGCIGATVFMFMRND